MDGIGGRRWAARWSALVLAALVSGGLPASVGAAGQRPDGIDIVKAIVMFDAKPGKAAGQAVERAGGRVRRELSLVNGLSIELPRGQLKQLGRERGVKSVELDHTVYALDHDTPTGDLEYDNAWGVQHIGAAAAHAAGVTGAGVKVAVIDTGIDYIHNDPDDDPYVVDPEFNSNYRGGYDFFNNDSDPMDDNGHGTHVSGILAAEKNGYLVVGVAPQVDLYALKILGANGEGDVSNLILALQWAVQNDIDVVNMSVGTHEVSPALATAVANAAAAGLLMVAASGNTVTIQEIFFGCPVTYPGAYPQVLSTTFTNGNDALTGYSCTGPEVDFAAPGDQIFAPVPTGSCMLCTPYGYAPESGTSMASPHLAGTVALLLDAGITDTGSPGLFDDVKSRLCATANPGWGVQTGFGGGTPIPTSDPRYPKYFGCGVIDADEAVLGSGPPVNHPPVATDDSLTTTEDAGPAAVNVLANDTDADGNALTITSITDPPHGTAAIGAGGNVSYTPDAGYNGHDAFDYAISDGAGGTDSGSVAVTVSPVDDPPTADAKTATATSGVPVTITLTGSDPDSCELTFQVMTLPSHGGVGSLTAQACTAGSPNVDRATVVYTPNASYSGPDSFTYRVADATGASAPVTVSVTVTAPASVHIADLDGSSSIQNKAWTARVTIQVHNGSHGSVAGAIVTGTWGGAIIRSASCTTTSTGTCTVQLSRLSRATVASVTFTITNVTFSGSVYQPAANHDLDVTDSNGTTIQVNRPV